MIHINMILSLHLMKDEKEDKYVSQIFCGKDGKKCMNMRLYMIVKN